MSKTDAALMIAFWSFTGVRTGFMFMSQAAKRKQSRKYHPSVVIAVSIIGALLGGAVPILIAREYAFMSVTFLVSILTANVTVFLLMLAMITAQGIWSRQ